MTARTDQAEITALVDRFFLALDTREFTPGWARPYLTDDASMAAPVGSTRGAEAVRTAETALLRFAGTQHFASGVVTDAAFGTDHATASWNAYMVHIHHSPAPDPLFVVGGRWEATLRRTAEGWRFTTMAVHVVWTRGEPPTPETETETETETG
ncbi:MULTISPECIES: nuclear transport factor 2 family protein [unclassified Streptomyces]|uniref:nuclear transport factor 2 family protein n=1 Tax=unclassified Streptomyces TaxID=2593676 RepID=UPI0001B53DF3|nr:MULTISPECIES: nuclear transport factor 2 family protein [unclassified Streptomyces]MYR30350.1 nuclear transport factor 2 family protein [Streptomyces sp. SID4945]SCD91722.1 SnoaL-like domain-containing protein [Streptomyces sp. TverLS-915]SCF49508.1 SnoaL-like domain-containing protein [Streptomyces sp. LcepLS]